MAPWEKYAPIKEAGGSPWKKYAEPAEVKKPEGPLTWGGAATEAVGNIPSSALQFGKNMAQPFIHPIETGKNIANVARGAYEKAFDQYGLIKDKSHEKYADAVKDAMIERYGSMENFKKTVAKDPVGVMADLSTVFTGGGSLAARAPGYLGKAGDIASTVGKVTNPLSLPIKAVEKSGDILAQVIGGVTTGAGGESIKQAFRSGVSGGKEGESFRDNMRGDVPMEKVVTDARSALKNMRLKKSKEYQSGMAGIEKDNTILDFNDVDKALGEANSIKRFKGIDISPSTRNVRIKITAAIDKWKKLDPAQYHTPAGLDALKQYVGDIKDSLPFNTPERLVADKVYSGIWETINKQAPGYSKVMKGYEQASQQIDEIARTLSLGKKATIDTALRKLQSAMRSNVNTNFGKRTDLAKTLSESGAPTLMGDLAGQSLSPWIPQGLGKAVAGGDIAAAAGMMHPAALAGLPFMSPRLMGEATHAAGRAVGKIPASIRDAAGKINPEILKKALLAARAAGILQ